MLQKVRQEKIGNLIQRRADLNKIFEKDCWRWLCQQVFTIDESAKIDENLSQGRVRPWPPNKPYLRDTIKILDNEQIVVIPKSRRMMVTWLVSGYLTHDAHYHDHSANFIVSEIEEKAAFCVDRRCHFIETNLRHEEFRTPVQTIRTKTGLIGRMNYPNGSHIWGLASKSDALRMYTATKVFVDEIEFIDEAPGMMRAVIPLLENGAQGIFVSSSDGPVGVLAQYCRDVGFGKWSDMVLLNGERVSYTS